MTRSFEVIHRLHGKTIATAESLTGGSIGAALTAVSGSSAVYKGGIISYTNEIKHHVLGVSRQVLDQYGAVSAQVAGEMVSGVRKLLNVDVAVSVTGLAGPGGDAFGNPVGTVFIGYSDSNVTEVKHCLFSGDREAIRQQNVEEASRLILSMQK